jgi:Mn2+/Fe2+ NRAMP family transporter
MFLLRLLPNVLPKRGALVVGRPNDSSASDVADRHLLYMALAMLSVALLYAANAAVHLTGPQVDRILEVTQVVLGLVAVALIAPMMLWKVRQRFDDLPSEFFIQLAIAVMLGVMSVVFLVLSRGSDEDESYDTPRA